MGEVVVKIWALKQTIKSASLAEGYKEFPLKVDINEAPGTMTAGKTGVAGVKTAVVTTVQNSGAVVIAVT